MVAAGVIGGEDRQQTLKLLRELRCPCREFALVIAAVVEDHRSAPEQVSQGR
jgi:hypothetical protein